MPQLTSLNLPPNPLDIRDDGTSIYDPLRRKCVIITPEEWVRQNFVAYLINQLHYPAPLMANEVSLTLNNTRRRCDTVVFDRHARPWMIVEYKAPDVPVTQQVFDQIARYNMVLGAPYLTVSNGLRHFCLETAPMPRYLSSLPPFPPAR